MRRYIARQLVQLVVVIIGISILAFVILHVLGDPVLLLLPQNAGHAEFERYRKLLDSTSRSGSSTGSSGVTPSRGTSANRGTPTRRRSRWSSSACPRRSI